MKALVQIGPQVWRFQLEVRSAARFTVSMSSFFPEAWGLVCVAYIILCTFVSMACYGMGTGLKALQLSRYIETYTLRAFAPGFCATSNSLELTTGWAGVPSLVWGPGLVSNASALCDCWH